MEISKEVTIIKFRRWNETSECFLKFLEKYYKILKIFLEHSSIKFCINCKKTLEKFWEILKSILTAVKYSQGLKNSTAIFS